LNAKVKFSGKFPNYKLDATAFVGFSFGCLISDVKQHVCQKRQSMLFGWLIYTVGKFCDTLKISTGWSSIFMIYPTKRMTKRTYEKKFLFNFLFVNQSLPSRLFSILNVDRDSTLQMTLYLIFRVFFHISVNQFVSKLVILRVWIFIPDITFFLSTFQHLFWMLGHSGYGHC